MLNKESQIAELVKESDVKGDKMNENEGKK